MGSLVACHSTYFLLCCSLSVFDTHPDLYNHNICVLSFFKQTNKPAAFCLGNRICNRACKIFRSAKCRQPLSFGRYLSKGIGFLNTQEFKWVCQACESSQISLQIDHIYSSPFLSGMQMSAVHSCCVKIIGHRICDSWQGVMSFCPAARVHHPLRRWWALRLEWTTFIVSMGRVSKICQPEPGVLL